MMQLSWHSVCVVSLLKNKLTGSFGFVLVERSVNSAGCKHGYSRPLTGCHILDRLVPLLMILSCL